MRKAKLVSFLILSLALSVTLPALTMGQTAAGGKGGGGGNTGGQSTPVPASTQVPGPASTPTPVIGDDDGDLDGDAEGCLGALYFLFDFGVCHHPDYFRFDGCRRR